MRHDTLLHREIGRHVVAGRRVAGESVFAIARRSRAGRVSLRAAALALPAVCQAGTLARAHDNAPAQVWQGERGAAVAAIHRAEEREQGGILGNRQEAAIGLQRAARAEIEARRDDLAKVFGGYRSARAHPTIASCIRIVQLTISLLKSK